MGVRKKNMADQLNKIRMSAHEKLRKESEVVVEVEKPSALQTAAVEYLSRKDEPHPLSQNKNLTEGKLNFLQTYIKQGKTAEEISELMLIDPKNIQKLMDAYDAKNELVEAVEVRTEDTIYLVKVSTKLADRIENYDEDDEIIIDDVVEPIKGLDLDDDIDDDDKMVLENE